MNKSIRIFLLFIVGGLGLIVWDGFYIVKEGQQAVVTMFGKTVGAPITEAGLNLKYPYFHKVWYFEKKILIWDGEPNQITTNDKTFVYMDNTARWRISDPLAFMQTSRSIPQAQNLLAGIIDGSVRDLVNKNDLIEIIRSSDWSPELMSAEARTKDAIKPPVHGRDKIGELVLQSASKITPQYGIEMIDVMFKRVNYIDTVREKVYERMISERKRIANERRSQGEGLKAEILGKVDREYKEITSGAQKEATEIRGRADAEATQIYGETYNKHPEFYAFLKSLESYRDIITTNTTLVLSSDSDLFKYMESIEGK